MAKETFTIDGVTYYHDPDEPVIPAAEPFEMVSQEEIDSIIDEHSGLGEPVEVALARSLANVEGGLRDIISYLESDEVPASTRLDMVGEESFCEDSPIHKIVFLVRRLRSQSAAREKRQHNPHYQLARSMFLDFVRTNDPDVRGFKTRFHDAVLEAVNTDKSGMAGDYVEIKRSTVVDWISMFRKEFNV